MTIGLCETCSFHTLITNKQKGTFHLCKKSKTDSAFSKYPRLPVLNCKGYQSTKRARRKMIEVPYLLGKKQQTYCIKQRFLKLSGPLSKFIKSWAGFLEAVYQEAIQIEMGRRHIPFGAQKNIRIRYKDQILQKEYVADFICYRKIIIELKALDELSGKEEAQILNYLKAAGLRVGLLINFGGVGKLEWKRFIK